MENLIIALIVTALVLDIAYFAVTLYREISIQRAIKKKIKEAVIRIQELEEEENE